VAMDEFLRAYAPVTMARLVKDDFEFEGCAQPHGSASCHRGTLGERELDADRTA
jgi:hypothetical protein